MNDPFEVSGRQADALETFSGRGRVLLEELGLEPGLELRRLQEAILAHDPAVVAVAAAPRRRGGLPAPVISVVDRDDAVGQVLERMRQHLRRAEELYRLALAVAGV